LLGGWEVAATGHGRPPADVVQAFGPLAGRRAVVDELVKDSFDIRVNLCDQAIADQLTTSCQI